MYGVPDLGAIDIHMAEVSESTVLSFRNARVGMLVCKVISALRIKRGDSDNILVCVTSARIIWGM